MIDEPISDIIKGYKKRDIKWGSRDFNNMVEHSYWKDEKDLDESDYDNIYLMNNLCRNTVVASMALSLLVSIVLKEYEEAVKKKNAEGKYICWFKYKKLMAMAEDMNLGVGTINNRHATFDNINYLVHDELQRMFMIKFKNNLSQHDLDVLESVYDTFDDVSKERKEEIKRECGNPFDVQINPYNK